MHPRAVALPQSSPWPAQPRLYELNTWVWLDELSRKHARPLDLATVPTEEWDSLAGFAPDGVWLMGVWERSPACIAIANQNAQLVAEFRRALPDFRPEDNVGSPYSIRRYVVDAHLGGPAGLAAARQHLQMRGMRLVLDFVPNHVAPDHPWVRQHPEYFIQGDHAALQNDPSSYLEIEGTLFARGRDPYFPAWPDVLQLNAFHPGLRAAVAETLRAIAEQCDGVRCDMAMLVINSIFEQTWGARAGAPPPAEYWSDLIPKARHQHPGFLFIAEAYWDKEWDLQQLGFDYCYDKRLYDRLKAGDPAEVRAHLRADIAYQGKLVRFLENHDEPRAAAAFSFEELRAASLVIATLPGMKLFHEGQFEGRKRKVPVFLGRRPQEPADPELLSWWHHVLNVTDTPAFLEGRWTLCNQSGWPDNCSDENLLAWCWISEAEHHVVIVNFSAAPAQAHVQLPWPELKGKSWRVVDALSPVDYKISGDDLLAGGFFVDLQPWAQHLLKLSVTR